MPPAKNSRAGKTRIDLIRGITTPLGFYVLSLLIVEATLALVLAASKLNEEHVWLGFVLMIGLFVLVFATVTMLVIWRPKNLLFGKEEHSNPELEKSALRDQIEDLIHANVKQECLQKAEKTGS